MGAGMLGPAVPAPKPSRSYRIRVPLNFEDVTQNAFDYAALVKKEKEKEGLPDSASASTSAVSPAGSVNGASSDDEHEASDSDRRPAGNKRMRKDEYDYDDDFIDDSDLFFAEVTHAPPSTWDYGFFVWSGPVENYFKEHNEKLQAEQKEKEEAAAALNAAANKKKKPTKRQTKKAAAPTPPDSSAEASGSGAAAASPSPPKAKRQRASPSIESSKKKAAAKEKADASAEVTEAEGGLSFSNEPLPIPESPQVQKRLFPEAQSSTETTTPAPSPPHQKGIVSLSSSDDDAPLTARTQSKPPTAPAVLHSISASPKPPKRTKALDQSDASSSEKKRKVAKTKEGGKSEVKDKERTKKSLPNGAPKKAKMTADGESAPQMAPSPVRITPAPSPAPASTPKANSVPDDDVVMVDAQGSGSEMKKSSSKQSKEREESKERKRIAARNAEYVQHEWSKLQEAVQKSASIQKTKGLRGELIPYIQPYVDGLLNAAVIAQAVDAQFIARLSGAIKVEEQYLMQVAKLYELRNQMREKKLAVQAMYRDMKQKIRETTDVQEVQYQKDLAEWKKANPASKDDEEKSEKPKRRYGWPENLRALLWNILCTEWEIAQATNEEHLMRNEPAAFKEGPVRKAVYAKIMEYFPDGWISSETISRVYSSVKKMAERRYENGNPLPHMDDVISGTALVPDPFAKVAKPRKSEVKVEDAGATAMDVDVVPTSPKKKAQAPASGSRTNRVSEMEDKVQQSILEDVRHIFAGTDGKGVNGHGSGSKEGFKQPKVPVKRRRAPTEGECADGANGKSEETEVVTKKSKKGHGSSSRSSASVKSPEGSDGNTTPLSSGGEGKREAVGGGKLKGAGGFNILD
ncbi:hypothetical protein HK097_008968 [Rhizophlyctis rosea]|uniref:Ubinuclein middle domain-containing protein n=1 Tax=Rhizophlyctis rosea TaxID=64517 RepID=A0AAD5SJ89_9FUNG|nr:hypothetical protein HK097_008968 [Rhizophlyctis rosea]